MNNTDNTSVQETVIVEKPIEEVAKVIEHTIEKTQNRKRKLLSKVISYMNEICEKNGLEYFAMGKLLTYYLEGEDPFPDTYTYHVGMLRPHYEVFLKEVLKDTENKNITASDMFNPYGILQAVNASLVIERDIFDEHDVEFIALKIILHPLDYIPEDPKERESFCRSVESASQNYRSLSRKYRNLEKDAGQLNGFVAKSRFLLNKSIFRTSFRSEKKKYLAQVTKYDKTPTKYVRRIQFMVHPEWLVSDIVPCKKDAFLNTELMLPHNIDFFKGETPEDVEKNSYDSRMEALKHIHEICGKNDVSYFVMRKLAIASTKGEEYLSNLMQKNWSIGMLRKDYEQFLQLVKEGIDPEIGLKDYVNEHPYISNNLVSVYLNRCQKRIPGEKEYLIYVFPFDVLPDDYDTKLEFAKEMRDMASLEQDLIDFEKGTIYDPPDTKMDTEAYHDFFHDERIKYNDAEPDSIQIYTIDNEKILVYPRNELLPPRKGTFMGQEISCPNNLYYWSEVIDNDAASYLAEKRIEILKIINTITEEQNIDYFAIAELLRAVVIYHDFIPDSQQKFWDLGLLRKDYDRFVEYMRGHASEYGVEFHESLDGKGKYPINVKYITKAGKKFSRERIRILPFDKVPEDFYLYHGFIDEMKLENEEFKLKMQQYDLSKLNLKEEEIELTEEEQNRYKDFIGEVPAQEAARIDQIAQLFNDDDRTSQYMRISLGQSKMISYDQIFPIKEVALRDVMVKCPRVTTVWQPTLDDELDRQVKCIQRADLLLLEEFDRVCTEMGVGYFVCGGTMLGYMRHGGFIPWDDDVDVAMLREDYEKFINEAAPYLKERFFLQTRKSDPNIPYLFSKLRLDDTEYITAYNEERDFHKGVCLDIFPFDFLPDHPQEREDFLTEIRLKAKKHHLVATRQYPIPTEECQPRNEKEAKYLKEQKKLLKKYWKNDLSVTQNAYYETVTRYNDKAKELGLHTVGSFVPSYTWIDLSDLLPYQRGTFENLSVSVPKRPDVFLKMQYGNFMQLPPKHMQIAHPLLRWSTWEDSSDRKE